MVQQPALPTGTPFGTWLKQRRKALDLTQEQLALRADLSLPTIAKIEAGQRRPSREVAELLARCLEVPAEQRAAFLQLARTPLAGQAAESQPAVLLQPADLPAPLSRLIGREDEMAELGDLLRAGGEGETRLLTLTGPGGVGKTRLAIALAWQLLPAYPDGAHFVSLVSLADPGLVLDSIARAVGPSDSSSRPPGGPEARLASHLAGKRVLLVLDNFEHLLPAAPGIAALLASCPHVCAIVTSRERLRVRGERPYRVQPLPLPDPGASPPPAELASSPAIALFLERAREASADFEFDDATVESIAAICAALEGLPLAIELAAARMDLLTPAGLLAELDGRPGEAEKSRAEPSLGRLAVAADAGAAPRDLPPRQRSLREAIGWSYQLLDSDEKRLFVRLGVFAGGFTQAAAEAVCNALGDLGVPMAQGLASLVRKSLLAPVHPRDLGRGLPAAAPEAGRRLGMLETIREYALERLAESGGEAEIRQHHAEYYLALAEAATPQVLAGPEQATWLRRLEEEHDNIRGALAWSIAGGPERAELALRLSGSLGRFWDMRGYVGEGRRWLDLALRNAAEKGRADSIPALTRAKALTAAGALAHCQGDHLAARAFHRQALPLVEQMGDKRRVASCLSNLGSVASDLDEYAEAQGLHEQALALMRELGDQAGIGRTLLSLGVLAARQGEYERARALYEESLALRRTLGDEYGIALLVGNLGDIAGKQGDFARAHALLQESLAMRESRGDERGIAFCLAALGNVACEEGNPGAARAIYGKALDLSQKLGDAEGLAKALEGMARAEIGLGRPGPAARLFGAAAALRRSTGSSIAEGERPRYERALAAGSSQLGEEAFNRAWAEGERLSPADAATAAGEHRS